MTVEGWIKDAHGVVALWKQREGGWVVLDVPSSVATVEFLPEPVQFKDGDVVRRESKGLWARGRWDDGVNISLWKPVFGAEHPSSMRMADGDIAGWLALGVAVRLVPEANGD